MAGVGEEPSRIVGFDGRGSVRFPGRALLAPARYGTRVLGREFSGRNFSGPGLSGRIPGTLGFSGPGFSGRGARGDHSQSGSYRRGAAARAGRPTPPDVAPAGRPPGRSTLIAAFLAGAAIVAVVSLLNAGVVPFWDKQPPLPVVTRPPGLVGQPAPTRSGPAVTGPTYAAIGGVGCPNGSDRGMTVVGSGLSAEAGGWAGEGCWVGFAPLPCPARRPWISPIASRCGGSLRTRSSLATARFLSTCPEARANYTSRASRRRIRCFKPPMTRRRRAPSRSTRPRTAVDGWRAEFSTSRRVRSRSRWSIGAPTRTPKGTQLPRSRLIAGLGRPDVNLAGGFRVL